MIESTLQGPATLTPELVTEMVKAGVVVGHNKSKTHPKMKPFIAGNRNEMEFIAPEATMIALDRATAFLAEVVSKGGLVLVVGTTAPAREALQTFAAEFRFPCVVDRWLGGTLTNFKMISDRLRYFGDIKDKRAKGELQKYTKKERLEFDKEIGKMAKSFDGLANLSRIPDAVFVVDSMVHETAVREAKRMRIPVVAILDTNDNPTEIEYPIYASDRTKSSIEWVMNRLLESLRSAKVAVVKEADPAAKKAV